MRRRRDENGRTKVLDGAGNFHEHARFKKRRGLCLDAHSARGPRQPVPGGPETFRFHASLPKHGVLIFLSDTQGIRAETATHSRRERRRHEDQIIDLAARQRQTIQQPPGVPANDSDTRPAALRDDVAVRTFANK